MTEQQTKELEEQINKNPLSYGYNAPVVPDDQFKISPSSASDFFGYKSSWFSKQFLKEDNFLGNNASIRGTYLHWLAQCYFEKKEINDNDIKEADEYVRLNSLDDRIDISADKVMYDLENMWDLLRLWIDENNLESSEEYISAQLTEHVILSGQVDYRRTLDQDVVTEDGIIVNRGSKIIGDYKSTGSKAMPKAPSYLHWFQAEVYATIDMLNGKDVDAVEVTYIKANVPGVPGKPNKDGISKIGKSYPTELKSFVKPFTKDDFDKKHGQMMNIAKTMEYFFKHPELADILFSNNLLDGMKFDVSKYQGTTEEALF